MGMSAVYDADLMDFAAEVGESDPVAVRGGGTRWTAGGAVAPGTRTVFAPIGLRGFSAR